ncbi:hypothetical protein CO174_01760, partial [Candidatus Uhrbacteria bacterium CG_4_9_14_3_um_filter_50_9]
MPIEQPSDNELLEGLHEAEGETEEELQQAEEALEAELRALEERNREQQVVDLAEYTRVHAKAEELAQAREMKQVNRVRQMQRMNRPGQSSGIPGVGLGYPALKIVDKAVDLAFNEPQRGLSSLF